MNKSSFPMHFTLINFPFHIHTLSSLQSFSLLSFPPSCLPAPLSLSLSSHLSLSLFLQPNCCPFPNFLCKPWRQPETQMLWPRPSARSLSLSGECGWCEGETIIWGGKETERGRKEEKGERIKTRWSRKRPSGREMGWRKKE